MRIRVNGSFVLALAALPACGAASPTAVDPPRGTGGDEGRSTVEIVWLEPPAPDAEAAIMPDSAAPPARATSPELGDGTAASETVAGAVRLLGLEVKDDAFVSHVLAGALVKPADLRAATLPARGDVARGSGVTAVVEDVDGALVHLVGLRGGRVERWVASSQTLRYARP